MTLVPETGVEPATYALRIQPGTTLRPIYARQERTMPASGAVIMRLAKRLIPSRAVSAYHSLKWHLSRRSVC